VHWQSSFLLPPMTSTLDINQAVLPTLKKLGVPAIRPRPCCRGTDMVRNFQWLCPDCRRGWRPHSTRGGCLLARHALPHLGFPHLLWKRDHIRQFLIDCLITTNRRSRNSNSIGNPQLWPVRIRISCGPKHFHFLDRGRNWFWYPPCPNA
jgi:hypothetical protein